MYNQVRLSWQDLKKKEAKNRFIVVSENQVQDLPHIGKCRIYSVWKWDCIRFATDTFCVVYGSIYNMQKGYTIDLYLLRDLYVLL